VTLGERIAALRKEKGFSQEGLGEQIGVSRQAVSKWEADKAVPDVDNCIAMSKVFGVPLARLLELEEGQNEPAAELNEQQLRLVEQVTERYLKAKAKAYRRWRWPIILAACVLLVGGTWVWQWLTDMNRTIEYLSGELAGMRGEIVSGVGDRVQESLEKENSLITDYAISVAAADVTKQEITYHVTANMKQVDEATQVRIMARVDGETREAEMIREAGLNYSAKIICPIQDGTAIYLLVEQDGQSRSELLETMELANDYAIHAEGWIRWAVLQQSGLTAEAFEPVEIHISMHDAPGLPYPPEAEKIDFGIFVNDKLKKTIPVDLANRKESYQEWRLSGEFDIPVAGVSPKEGDTLTFAVLVQDNYGRKASEVLSRYEVQAGGALVYRDYDMLDLEHDGTYGTEVWS